MTAPKNKIILILLAVSVAMIVPAALFTGAADVAVFDAFGAEADGFARLVVLETRLPAILCAICSGMALAMAGLLMQTVFNNPLAGPSIMGISSGANLGVAIMVLMLGAVTGFLGHLAIVGAALAGAIATMALLLLFAVYIKSGNALLIVGILIGYIASSAITLLNFFASDQNIHSFVLWGLGSFSVMTLAELPLYASLCVGLCAVSLLLGRSLNAMLLGDGFAANVGVDVPKVRAVAIFIAGALTAVVTAWCGPVAFVGLVAPHIARLMLRSSNHMLLMPATLLCGALMAGVCQIICVSPVSSSGALPVNAITPVIGVPVIIYVMLNRRKILYFN